MFYECMEPVKLDIAIGSDVSSWMAVADYRLKRMHVVRLICGYLVSSLLPDYVSGLPRHFVPRNDSF